MILLKDMIAWTSVTKQLQVIDSVVMICLSFLLLSWSWVNRQIYYLVIIIRVSAS